MDSNFEETFSNAFECDPELVPYLPRLVTDMWALGSWPDKYVELLKSLDLDFARARVLDLGCGKGAVTITLALDLGCAALGIDICEPFIEYAKKKAAENGVGDRCRFELGDIRRYAKQPRDFDIVVYASLGNTLGGFGEIAGSLRNCVKMGGYMLIDDGFLKDSAVIKQKCYRHYLSYDETTALLTSHGDKLVREIGVPDIETKELCERYVEAITIQADAITAEQPALAKLFARYIKSQENECAVIDEIISGAIWLLERGE